MTTRSAVVKAPGEKLLRVSLDLGGGVVRAARISGDFFIHPEEGVLLLEKALCGAPEWDELVLRLQSVIDAGGLELVGVSIESIARGALEAVSEYDAETSS